MIFAFHKQPELSAWTYLELFEGAFLLHDVPVNLIVLLAEVAERVGDFFLLLVSSFPRRDEVVGLEQRELLVVRRAHVQAVLVQHNGLADHLALSSSLESSKRCKHLSLKCLWSTSVCQLTLFCRLVALFIAAASTVSFCGSQSLVSKTAHTRTIKVIIKAVGAPCNKLNLLSAGREATDRGSQQSIAAQQPELSVSYRLDIRSEQSWPKRDSTSRASTTTPTA